MIYFPKPKAHTNHFKFSVPVIGQVPQMHKLMMDGFSIHLKKSDDKTSLNIVTYFISNY